MVVVCEHAIDDQKDTELVKANRVDVHAIKVNIRRKRCLILCLRM